MNSILTIPNLVSFVRLAAIPWFWWVTLVDDRIGLSAALIFLIGSTDWVDGYLARRLGQVTELGKILDPVADRLMIGSALIAGLIAGVVPAVIGIPLVVREVLVGGATLVALRRGSRIDVHTLGKTATFLLYGAIPSFYLTEAGIVPDLFGPPAWLAGTVGLALYYLVGVRYLREATAVVRGLGSGSVSSDPG